MHSEDRSDKRALPQSGGHALQRHKKKQNGERVQEDIGKVVPTGMQAVQLAIQHMCDRSKRVPILGMDMGKCPRDIGEVDAAADSGVLIDVARIVVIDEIVPNRLSIDDPCYDEQTDTNAGAYPTLISPEES